jgi:hypothetical protein
MRKTLVATVAALALALALAGAAGAALSPSVYDPGNTGCPKSTYSHGVLHLEKNCATATNASAGARISGLIGQAFTSATFTLASAAQCQGGSPRFNVTDSNGKTFFLGCNNVTPTTNGNGTATYTFTAADLTRINPTLGTPGTIAAVEIVLDVQGTADVTNISVNGVRQVVVRSGDDNDHGNGGGAGHQGDGAGHQGDKSKCKNGGWKPMTNPKFKNQGQCVSYFNHLNKSKKSKSGKQHS